MNKKKISKLLLRAAGIIILAPLTVFLLLAILIYIPPVQNYVVDRVAEALSDSTGLSFRIDKVRLAFPLDLTVHGIEADQRGDSVLNAELLKLDLQFLPLLKGQADIDAFELHNLKLNTRDLVSNTQIAGNVGKLTATAHGINWKKNLVKLDNALLSEADFVVTLCDTAQEDTTKSAPWIIDVGNVTLNDCGVSLTMPGDTMSIAAYIGAAILQDGHFDTGKPLYTIGHTLISGSSLKYDLLTAAERSRTAGQPVSAKFLQPIDAVRRLDMNHINIAPFEASIKDLSYDQNGVLRVNVEKLSAKETGSGFSVDNIAGQIYYDSTKVSIPALKLHTPYSNIEGDIMFNFAAFDPATKPGNGISIKLNSKIGWQDVQTLSRGYVPDNILKALPKKEILLRGDVSGNLQQMNIRNLNIDMPGIMLLTGNVQVNNATESWRSGTAQLNFVGKNLSFVNGLLPKDVRQTVRVPNALTAKGTVNFNGERYGANVLTTTGGGTALLKGNVDLATESFSADVKTTTFPLKVFLPTMPLHPITAQINATGKGFDVLSPHSHLTAKANIQQFHYDTYNLSNIKLDARSKGGIINAAFAANNSLIEGNGTITATLDKIIKADIHTNLPRFDLAQLTAEKDTMKVGLAGHINFYTNRDFNNFGAKGFLNDIHLLIGERGVTTEDVNFNFASSPDTTSGQLSSGDLRLAFGAKGELTSSIDKLLGLADVASKQIERRTIDQRALQQEMPVLSLQFDSGTDNPLMKLAKAYDISFDKAYIRLNSNPRDGLNGTAHIGSLRHEALMLDTINARIITDSSGLQVYALVHNFKKQNPNKFEAQLKTYLHEHGAGLETIFKDREGRVGLNLGASASMLEGGYSVKIYPENPVIAYRNFSVNKDNFIFINKDFHIGAGLDLLADDGTGLKLYGTPQDSLTDLTLSLSHVNLGELAATIPYMPEMRGMLEGDIHITDDHRTMSAMASLNASNFEYAGTKLGDVGIEGIYLPKEDGDQYASAFISSGGQEVLECNGTYHANETFDAAGTLHDFPLAFLNSFLSGTDVMLKGIGAGEFTVAGSIDAPKVNGRIAMENAHIFSNVYGFDFRMDEQPVIISDSRVVFNDYALYSTGSNPLRIDGKLDVSNLDRISMDFAMKASDFELINTKKKKESMIYGKVFTNFNGSLRGDLVDGIYIRGNLEVLPKTDVTYILKDSPLSVENRLDGLVKFVSFEDTLATEPEAVEMGAMDLTLGIGISDAAKVLCLLSEDGQSYVDIQGGGNLTMRQTRQGDTRLTGRLTIGQGKMKYELPVIPLKTFAIKEGSYIEFNGDMMNPTLNIAATERMKSTVTDNGQSRSVAFDVGMNISQTLSNLGLEFTIEAPEDLMMQNTLAAMTTAERGKTAVSMLATGMFLSDDADANGTGLKASNALNAFLQSEIQNIAGNALKTIDVSLGVESGTSAKGTATTDYSFQFAKHFWGDRVTVVIGGRVSTGADATNTAESFIDNISLEYRLDRASSRQLKLFYDRATQDPLEGQLSKAGAGFVMRKKSDSLGELFIFKRKKEE